PGRRGPSSPRGPRPCRREFPCRVRRLRPRRFRTRRRVSFLHHDFGKIRQTCEFLANGREEGEPVVPEVLLRTIDEHFDEESVEGWGDRGDRLHGLAVVALG